MSRVDKEGVILRESVIAENNVYQANVQILTVATITLPLGCPPLQFLDANGVARTVNLPTNSVKGTVIKLANTAAGVFAITVKDLTSATTVATIANGKSAEFWCNGDGTVTAWKVLLSA